MIQQTASKMKSVNKLNKKREEPNSLNSLNFEKLYMNSSEIKQEVTRTLSLFKEFFNNYISQSQSCDSTEVLNFLMKMEENKARICNSKNFKLTI
jgi:predicted metallo-beta-lactamase superfamily hydrolase